MKKIKITLGIAAMSLAILTVQSCGNQESKTEEVQTETQNHQEEQGEEADAYACPMHPEITGKEGDKCSECGMNLTPISGDDHEGHNH
jgi:hypothetical protein